MSATISIHRFAVYFPQMMKNVWLWACEFCQVAELSYFATGN